MKKSNSLFGFLTSLVFGLFFVERVSAQYYGSSFGVENFIDSMTRILEPILIALFGGHDYTGYLLFEKLLLFILFAVFSYLALRNFPFFEDKNKYLARLIAIIVSLLGIRNLNYVWVNTILTQYAVLFVAITGILPFVIYWFFLKEFDSILRKVGWIFFSVVYFGLWITTDLEAYESVYLITALTALGYAFFLDTAVHKWLAVQQFKKGRSDKIADIIAGYSEQIEKIQKRIRDGHYPTRSMEKRAEKRSIDLHRKILRLQKKL